MNKLEQRIKYQFKNREVLKQALTHSSYGYEKGKPHNERLEFLGDAILGFVISEWLFSHHPDADEGVLSKQKSALVSEETLAKKALELGLGSLLNLGKGELRSGGKSKPSILSDAVEALIAAVERDGGFTHAQQLIWRLFEPELEQELLVLKNDQDFKSLLQEKTQEMGLGFPEYKIKNITGPEHKRVFQFELMVGEVKGPIGKGTSKKRAQQESARKALADERFWEKIESRNKKERS
ncbi:MAG: ribonuclease III [Acidobacteria bacterium]|nr:MAG: ribonuclease III [Acidobacteriota bacterium]